MTEVQLRYCALFFNTHKVGAAYMDMLNYGHKAEIKNVFLSQS